eukprot:6262760-Amphidinium_carterae.1
MLHAILAGILRAQSAHFAATLPHTRVACLTSPQRKASNLTIGTHSRVRTGQQEFLATSMSFSRGRLTRTHSGGTSVKSANVSMSSPSKRRS